MCTEAAPPWDNAQVKDEPVSSSFFTCQVNIALCDTHPCTWWHPEYAMKQKADMHPQRMTNELKSVWVLKVSYMTTLWCCDHFSSLVTQLDHWDFTSDSVAGLMLRGVSGLWMSFVLFTLSHLKNLYLREVNWCVAPPWRDPPGLH